MKQVMLAKRIHDLSFLRETPAGEGVPLDVHDPRYLQITDLVQEKAHAKAADAAMELLTNKHYDVRLLGYPLLQDFFEDGPATLVDALALLRAVVEKNLAAFGPTEKRDILLNKTLTGLFQTILDAMEYRRLKDDAVWKGWIDKLEGGAGEEAAKGAHSLSMLLSTAVYRQSAELLARLSRTMRDLDQRVTAGHAGAEAVEELTSVGDQGALAASPGGTSIYAIPGQMVQLRGSAKFIGLCNKLRAFEVLIEKEDYRRAALVSDDLMVELGNFDPREYFPDLFSTFGALLNANVAKVKPHWDGKNSVEWKMLEQFYRVDLETFTKGE